MLAIPVFAQIMLVSCLLPFVAALVVKQLLPGDFRAVLWYFGVYGTTATLQLVLSAMSIRNWWVINLTTIAELVAIAYLFKGWEPDEKYRRVYVVVQTIFIALWVVAKLTVEDINGTSPYITPLSHVLIAVGAIRALYNLAYRMASPLYLTAHFWTTVGIMLASMSDLLFTSILPIVVNFASLDLERVFYIHWGRVILVNLLFVGGLLLCKVPIRSSGGSSSSAP